jgi:hypothetical protein
MNSNERDFPRATPMRFDDSLAYLEKRMLEIGFSRDRETFTKSVRNPWSYWLVVSGNDHIISSNLGLLHSEVSQLVHSSLLQTTGVDTRELRRNAARIPVYQLPLQAIDPSASKLIALNPHRDGINKTELDRLIDFIIHVGIPHLDEMMDLERIGRMLKAETGGHFATYLTPAILFLQGDKKGAELRIEAQATSLATNPKALRIYLSYCYALRANISAMHSK